MKIKQLRLIQTKIFGLGLLIMILILITGCTPTENTYRLTYTAGFGGKIEGNYQSGKKLPLDQLVTLNAIADPGYQFSQWNDDGMFYSSDAQIAFSIDKDYQLEAIFIPDTIDIANLLTLTVPYQANMSVVVVFAFKECLLVTDFNNTGYIYIYKNNASIYQQGDILEINGTLKIDQTHDNYFDQTTTIVKSSQQNYYQGQPQTYNPTNFKEGSFVKASGTLTKDSLTGQYSLDQDLKVIFNQDYSWLDQTNLKVVIIGYLTYNLTNTPTILVTQVYLDNGLIVNISDLKESTVGSVIGSIAYINTDGLIIDDTTSRLYVKIPNSSNYQIGDQVLVTGTISLVNQGLVMTSVTEINIYGHQPYHYPPEIEINDLDDYFNTNSIGSFVKVTGTLSKTSNYYNLNFSNSSKILSIQGSLDNYDNLVGNQVTVLAFVIGLSGNYFQVVGFISEQVASTKTISLLEINDLHGYLYNGDNNVSQIAYKINQIRDQYPSILVGNGDMFQGTALSNLTYGLSVVNIMNAMGFDLMGIGNHEFDWGLDKVLRFFDGDPSNGEANFPLINSNVYYQDSGHLVTITNGKIFESIIITRGNLKIGVVSYIGNLASSINYEQVKDYYFDQDFKTSLDKIATSFKTEGVNLVLANVHGGSTSGPNNYQVNQTLANFKYQGQYLIDAIFNGHTHSYQYEYITRSGGQSVPVIQAAANGLYLGEILVTYDPVVDVVINTEMNIYSAKQNPSLYDQGIYDLLTIEYNQVKDQLEEVYTVSNETVSSSYDLAYWMGSVLRAGTGADISVANYGGIRSNGGIKAGLGIDFKMLYEICPFDNQIFLIKVKGSEIVDFLARSSSVYYDISDQVGGFSQIKSNQDYYLSVIDYVYYWSDFPKGSEVIKTGLFLRDLMIIDLRLRESFSPLSNYHALLTNQLMIANYQSYLLGDNQYA